MKSEAMLSERGQLVLCQLAALFVETGEPVSSAQIARREAVTVSSATVRHALSDLEQGGYVRQPHTSAGRVPTAAGLRVYVETLRSAEASPIEEEPLSLALAEAFSGFKGRDVEGTAKGMGLILSGLARMTTLMTLPAIDELTLCDLHLTALSGWRVLAVLVTSDEKVHQRVVQLGEELSLESVRRMESYLSQLALGKTLREVHRGVLKEKLRLTRERERWLEQALVVGEQALELKAPAAAKAVLVEGALYMFDYSELTSDIARFREILYVLEERERVLELLEELMVRPERPRVLIGPELELGPGGDELGLIACAYGAQEGGGVLGLLGPSRMDYARLMPLMRHAAELFEAYLARAP